MCDRSLSFIVALAVAAAVQPTLLESELASLKLTEDPTSSQKLSHTSSVPWARIFATC